MLEILVRAGAPVTLSELMVATGLPKPSLHRTLALFEEAKSSRLMAQGMAVAGVGAAGVAVWMFVRKDKREPAPIAHVGKFAVEPAVTTSRVGFQLTNRF